MIDDKLDPEPRLMKNILIWGFYEEGNIGDDIMALMFYRLLQESGHRPIIFSPNDRFRAAGFETTAVLDDLHLDGILLGGGAVFQTGLKSRPATEAKFNSLADFIEQQRIAVVGASLGSDGLQDLSLASPGRQRLFSSNCVRALAVRLKKDIALVPGKSVYRSDIVLCTGHFRRRFYGGSNASRFSDLVNITRRAVWAVPLLVGLSLFRKTVSFFSHCSPSGFGGEVRIPNTAVFQSCDITETLEVLSSARRIISSKLHPGIMTLSLGGNFCPVSPRTKTRDFLADATDSGILEKKDEPFSFTTYRLSQGLEWQSDLWNSYREFLRENFA